ncbi:hypothetical protein ABPG77_001528 [Micractinium sp. CCAP 211/92]
MAEEKGPSMHQDSGSRAGGNGSVPPEVPAPEQQASSGLLPVGRPPGAGEKPAETVLADLGLAGLVARRAQQRARGLESGGGDSGSGPLPGHCAEQQAASGHEPRRSSMPGADARPGESLLVALGLAGQAAQRALAPPALGAKPRTDNSNGGSREGLAWCIHLLLWALVGMLTGTLAAPGTCTGAPLARRMLCFASIGAVCSLAGAAATHALAMVSNTPDDSAVHAELARFEQLHSQASILIGPARLGLPGRLALLMLQASLFLPLLVLHAMLPVTAQYLEAYRAGEQRSNLTQAIRSFNSGAFPGVRSSPTGSLAAAGQHLPDGMTLRDALINMREQDAHSERMALAAMQLRSAAPDRR